MPTITDPNAESDLLKTIQIRILTLQAVAASLCDILCGRRWRAAPTENEPLEDIEAAIRTLGNAAVKHKKEAMENEQSLELIFRLIDTLKSEGQKEEE